MQQAIDPAFDAFIHTLYTEGKLPTITVVDDALSSVRYHHARTGRILVLSEDETTECPVFGNWGTYYAFMGWLEYRAMNGQGNEFSSMVADLLNSVPWSDEAARWIAIINGLVVMQGKYDEKYGHCPADLTKFVKSYIRYGEATVLYRDRY